uniref:Uncharacterized protein n=1 Tax=Plectus sambesii TaxID=2011161 RepID=A0A914W069_9BILA
MWSTFAIILLVICVQLISVRGGPSMRHLHTEKGNISTANATAAEAATLLIRTEDIANSTAEFIDASTSTTTSVTERGCANGECIESTTARINRPVVVPNTVSTPSWVFFVGFLVFFVLIPVVLFLAFTAGADFCKKSVLWNGEGNPRAQPNNNADDEDYD